MQTLSCPRRRRRIRSGFVLELVHKQYMGSDGAIIKVHVLFCWFHLEDNVRILALYKIVSISLLNGIETITCTLQHQIGFNPVVLFAGTLSFKQFVLVIIRSVGRRSTHRSNMTSSAHKKPSNSVRIVTSLQNTPATALRPTSSYT